MVKMWAGRTDGETSKLADDFNSSISFDCRMYREDIREAWLTPLCSALPE